MVWLWQKQQCTPIPVFVFLALRTSTAKDTHSTKNLRALVVINMKKICVSGGDIRQSLCPSQTPPTAFIAFWSFAHFVTPCCPFDRHKSLSFSSLQQLLFLLLSEATLPQLLSIPGDRQQANLPHPTTCFKNIIIFSVTVIATLPAIDGRPSFWIGQIR